MTPGLAPCFSGFPSFAIYSNMDLKGILLNERRQRQTSDVYFTYMWNLKNKMNEYNRTETDSSMQRRNQWLSRGGGGGWGGLMGTNSLV